MRPERHPVYARAWFAQNWVPLLALVAIVVIVASGAHVMSGQLNNVDEMIATIGAISAGLGAVLVTVQLRYMDRAQRILERQDAELHQRADLVLWASAVPVGPFNRHQPTRYLTISAWNRGARAVTRSTLQLALPSGLTLNQYSANKGWRGGDAVTLNGATYAVVERDFKRFFLPGIPAVLIANASFTHVQDVTIATAPRWRLLYADAVTSGYQWRELTTVEDLAAADQPPRDI